LYIFLGLLSTGLALSQESPRDFHFGPSGQTTVALSDSSLIEVSLNGKGPFKLFFDTGANVNILNPDLIAQLGLEAVGDPATVLGASGRKIETKPFRASEVRIGELTLTGQTFYSIPLPLPASSGVVGAIGYELMSRVVAQADYPHHQLSLFDPSRFTYSGKGEKLELLPCDRSLLVHGRIGKYPADLNLDTGSISNIGITVNAWFARQNHLPRRAFLHHYYYGSFGGGADGEYNSSLLDRIKETCLGQICLQNTVGSFLQTSTSTGPIAGILSMEAISRFILTIDWPHHALYIEKGSNWQRPAIFNQTGLAVGLPSPDGSLPIDAVYPFSPAKHAHIKAGDRILRVNQQPPASTWEITDPAFLQPAGTQILLTIQRGDSTLEIPLKLKDIL
jgi:hypothetical protein